MFMKQESVYATRKATIYAVVLGQCTEAMKAKLEANDAYQQIATDSNVIKLLKLVRVIAYNYESESYPFMAVVSAKKAYYTQVQKYYTTNKVFLDQFNNLQDVIEHSGRSVGNNDNLVIYTLNELNYDPDSSKNEQYQEAITKTKEAYETAAHLSCLNGSRYQGLLDELANAYLNGRNKYPKNMVVAYKLVINWKGGKQPSRKQANQEVAFVSQGEEEEAMVNDNKGKVRTKIGKLVKCYKCGGNHWLDRCKRRPVKRNKMSTPPIRAS